jgi:hypothetical protein
MLITIDRFQRTLEDPILFKAATRLPPEGSEDTHEYRARTANPGRGLDQMIHFY